MKRKTLSCLLATLLGFFGIVGLVSCDNNEKPQDAPTEEVPNTPEKPGETDKPSTPETPQEGEKPSTPEGDKPSTPETPQEGDKPSTPEGDKPVTPEKPEGDKPITPEKPDTPTTPEKPVEPEVLTLTVAEAEAKAMEFGDTYSDTKYVIKGVIEKITSDRFGNMVIKDETGSLFIYGTYNNDGSVKYGDMTDKPVVGDEVTLLTILGTYNGKAQGKNAFITEFKTPSLPDTPVEPDTPVDPDKPVTPDTPVDPVTIVSIKEARNASVGSLVTIKGQVARVILGQNGIKVGVYLVDNTDSIYVEGAFVDGLEVGNTITVKGSKDMYIPKAMAQAASKKGYQGLCKLIDAELVENDSAVNKLDLSSATEITMEALLAKTFSDNISTQIYKVKGIITKEDNGSYVKYIINDETNTFGSFVYSQNSGSDFADLDEFVGKTCTIYLAVHDCRYKNSKFDPRLMPVHVELI